MVRATIIMAALVVYLPVWNAPFHFDDFSLFTDPLVVGEELLDPLWSSDRTRPLTYLTFRANYTLNGFAPGAFHLVNLAVFALAIWIAGLLFERLLPRRVAWLATAVFALHPLAVESTAYVFGRASLLATGFAAACWLCWVHGRRVAATFLFGAAVLAKEDAAAMAAVLLGYEWFVVRGGSRRWTEIAPPLAAMFGFGVLVVTRLIVATLVAQGAGAGFALEGVTPGAYLLTQGKVIWLYMRLLVAPWGQSFDHSVALSAVEDVWAWLGWAMLLWAAYFCLRNTREDGRWYWPLAGLLLLAPTSTAFPLADLAAERRMMLPMLAFAPVLALVLAGFFRSTSLGVATVAISLALGGLAWRRAQVWSSAESLWRDTVRTAPEKTRPRLQLARALESKGEEGWDERFRILADAQKIAPEDPIVLGELGVLLLQAQRPAMALEAFEKARAAAPDDPQLAANAGASLLLLGRSPEAVAAFERALELDACNFDARNNLIYVRRTQGNLEEIRRLAEEPPGCRWTPDQSEAIRQARTAPAEGLVE